MKKKVESEEMKRLQRMEDRLEEVQEKVEETNGIVKMSVVLVFLVFVALVLFNLCSYLAEKDSLKELEETENDRLLQVYCQEKGYNGFVEDYGYTGIGEYREGYCYKNEHEPYGEVVESKFKLWKKIREVNQENQNMSSDMDYVRSLEFEIAVKSMRINNHVGENE